MLLLVGLLMAGMVETSDEKFLLYIRCSSCLYQRTYFQRSFPTLVLQRRKNAQVDFPSEAIDN